MYHRGVWSLWVANNHHQQCLISCSTTSPNISQLRQLFRVVNDKLCCWSSSLSKLTWSNIHNYTRIMFYDNIDTQTRMWVTHCHTTTHTSVCVVLCVSVHSLRLTPWVTELAYLLDNRDTVEKCLNCVRHNTISNVVDDSCSPWPVWPT